MRKMSRDHRLILEITDCGSGGQAAVYKADLPNANVVIKVPLDPNAISNAMEETHLIESLYDKFLDC